MTRIAEWHRSKVVRVCYDVVCTCGKALPSSLGRQARKSECDTELKCRRGKIEPGCEKSLLEL